MKLSLNADPTLGRVALMAALTFLETLIGALILLLDSEADITTRAVLITILVALLPLVTTILGHLKREEETQG